MWTTGPMPAVPDYTAPQAPIRETTDPQPRVRGATGPQPSVGTGSQPSVGTGPQPRVGTGAQSRVGTGPQPRVRDAVDDDLDLGDERPRLLDRLLRRDWLDSDDGFFGRRSDRAKPPAAPDLEEIEFWANLRAETSVWIRRGRR
jgi:hypothetical protein